MTMSNFNDTQNKQLVNTAIDELKLNPRTDAVPQQVIPTIQPVFELKRKTITVFSSASASNATSALVYTTPSDRDFYLVASHLSMKKDGSSPSTSSSIVAVPDSTGAGVAINFVQGSASLAQEAHIYMDYPLPIKLKRNSQITVTNSSGTATIIASAFIYGYTEDAGPQYI